MFLHTRSLSYLGLSHHSVRASGTHQVNEVTEILLYLLRRQTPHQIQGTIQLLVTLRKQEHPSVTVHTDKHITLTGTRTAVLVSSSDTTNTASISNQEYALYQHK